MTDDTPDPVAPVTGDGPWRRVVGGRPVPWVTTWSQEAALLEARQQDLRDRSDDTAAPVQTVRWDTGDGTGWSRVDVSSMPTASLLDRKGGWWWMFHPDAQGEGRPLWSDVNGRRQRLSMLKMLCQVCAVPLRDPSPDEPFGWVVADLLDDQSVLLHGDLPDDGTVVTADAPTCHTCAETAVRLCPALVEHRERLTVVGAEPWGVRGTTYDLTVNGFLNGAFADDGYPVRTTTIARQLLVRLRLADRG